MPILHRGPPARRFPKVEAAASRFPEPTLKRQAAASTLAAARKRGVALSGIGGGLALLWIGSLRLDALDLCAACSHPLSMETKCSGGVVRFGFGTPDTLALVISHATAERLSINPDGGEE